MILDKFKLDGNVAIVTGANTGLGQGMSIALASAGASVVLVGRSSCSDTIKKIKEINGECFEVIVDLQEFSSIDILIDKTIKKYGKIDILVNNAGIIRRDDTINLSVKDWDEVINLNQKNLFFLSQSVAKKFIEQKSGGKIINIASMLSYQGGIRTASYTASKSAVMGLTKIMANEWAKYNINVNAIAPGYMITNNTKNIREDDKRYDEITSRIPAGRWGMPEDLGGAVVFLASQASNYVNGFTLAVDGGWLAR